MNAAHVFRGRRVGMIEALRRNVPHELRDIRAWLLWKFREKVGRSGEWDKVPYYASKRIRAGAQGSESDLAQLVEFGRALEVLEASGAASFDGVGLAILPCHEVCALDLDKLDLDPARRAFADSVTGAGSYVEHSPSGRGLRALFRSKPGIGNHKNHVQGIELFEDAGFVTVTGDEITEGADLAPMPESLRVAVADRLALRNKARPTSSAAPDWQAVDLSAVPERLRARLQRGFPPGSEDRSAYLYGLCFALRGAGLSETQAFGALGDTAATWLAPALERRNGDIASAREWLWKYCVTPAYAQPMDSLPAGADATPESMSLDQMLARFVHVARGPLIVDLRNTYRRLRPVEFNAAFGHCKVVIEKKAVPVAALWAQHEQRMTADALTFNPGESAFFQENGLRHLNMWAQPTWPEVDGRRATQFLEHLEYLVPDSTERADLLDWLAHAAQMPTVRPHHHFLLVASAEGTGRSWLAEVLRRVWGDRHAGECDLHRLLDDTFNTALSGKIVLAVHEVKAPAGERYSHRDRLKSLLTDQWITVNEKNQPRWNERFCARFLMFSNRDDALPLSETDRRIYAVRCADTPRSAGYYSALYKRLDDSEFLAAVWQFLRTRDIRAFNPGRRAPLTEMKEQMIAAGRTEEQEIAVEFVKACPHPVIAAGDLMRAIVPELDGERRPEHRTRLNAAIAVLREVGCQTYPRKVWFENRSTRMWMLRDYEDWRRSPAAVVIQAATEAQDGLRRCGWSPVTCIQKWRETQK